MNANDELKGYNCIDNYYRYAYGLFLTDGTKALVETFDCYWFIDIIAASQQSLKEETFQVWSLGKDEDGSAIIVCTDGNNKVIKVKKMPHTDFNADEATVWVEHGVALLPTEH
jgi:hypothetical protein